MLSWPPSLLTSFVACFGHQSKNEVALFEVNIFQKSAKTEVSKIMADQDRKASALYHILSAPASSGFYNVSDMFSPKIKTLSQR